MNKLKKLIAITGKAGTGKDSIAYLTSRRLNIPIAISFTTRDKRETETDGVEYNFITDKEFQDKLSNGEIIEYASYNIESENRTYTYGLAKEEIEKSKYVLAIVNPRSLCQLQKSKYKDNIITILLECNDRERLLRYMIRDKTVNVEEMIDRYKRDKLDFSKITGEIDYIVYNEDKLEKAVDEVVEIILEEMRD